MYSHNYTIIIRLIILVIDKNRAETHLFLVDDIALLKKHVCKKEISPQESCYFLLQQNNIVVTSWSEYTLLDC